MREVRAVDALARHLESDPEYGVRLPCAKALGAIGEYQISLKTAAGAEVAERIRTDLLNAYQRENGSDGKNKDHEHLLDNLAIALAKVRDRTGLGRIRAMLNYENEDYRVAARYLLESLEPAENK
jgi:hypothetical protein